MYGSFRPSLTTDEHPNVKYFYVVINPITKKIFINKESYYPMRNYDCEEVRPFSDPFIDDIKHVKLHNTMKAAERTAAKLIEEYTEVIGFMKDQYDENLEIIADEINDPTEDAGYIKHLQDENAMIFNSINSMEKILSSKIEARRIIAMCII